MRRLPVERDPRRPLDPPPALRGLPPMTRLEMADGHLGWLATTLDAARAVLGDPRFSARQELKHPAVRSSAAVAGPGRPAPPGFFATTDPPEHTRYRRLLTGEFTVRRMRLLEPRIERIAADHLDAMAAAGPPADLVTTYALPIPSMVICELLGVPYADHDFFQERSRELVAPGGDVAGASADLHAYLAELVRRKRSEPGDDLISGLTGELADDAEPANVAMILLVAGHETTANMLALGVLALLTAGLTYEEGAEEELLRWLSILHLGAPSRAALEDVEVAGVRVAKGETVAVSLPVVNRDPAAFAAPDTLDPARQDARRHLAFGHGVHQCLGQQLARNELRIGYRALFDRFPGLRLAVPATEVPLRQDATVFGVGHLPVTWD
ncbi:cytochrome P450 [Nonomuraea wenchangensis]|uniref:cytochrome P450 n=1 Tax=Nonomuraea wenchangensis TaxID=568860 RepID=UPI0034381C5C